MSNTTTFSCRRPLRSIAGLSSLLPFRAYYWRPNKKVNKPIFHQLVNLILSILPLGGEWFYCSMAATRRVAATKAATSSSVL